MQMRKRLADEKGSMSAYVLIVIAGFLLILISMYSLAMSARKSQLKTTVKIKESYELENNNIEEVYQKVENKTYVKSGLILHYDAINNTGTGHSNNTTTWKDISEHENNGTLQNFAMDSNSGWTEDGLQFNGSTSFVDIINPMYDKIGGNPNMTIEVIFTTQQAKDEAILSFKRNTDDQNFMDLWSSTEIERGYESVYYYNNSENLYLLTQYPRTQYTLGKPIAITYGLNDDQFFSYANGTDRKAVDRIENAGWDTNKLYLGKSTSDNNYFTGIIKSVRIYDRTLTEEEIQRNYQVDKIRFNL